jgi:hypothetical protein
MLGVAAVAAALAMAFIGSSAAMAEVGALCGTDPAGGACASPLTHVHYIATTLKLKTPVLTVTCEALYLGDALSGLAAPLVIHGNYTFSNCNNGCTITETSASALVFFLREGTELSKVTVEYNFHVTCTEVIECTYNGEELVGHGLGGLITTAAEKGHVTFTKAPVRNSGGLICPPSAELTALFESLSKEYIGS